MTIDRRRGSDFGLSVDCISKGALNTVQTLQEAGYSSYIVGGGVRDLLLKKKPKDFDIATAAHPEEIRHLFRRCRLIGKRFRLAHVRHKKHLFEVATYRANYLHSTHKNLSAKKRYTAADNKYGTLEEDLIRRDFTINAMYYDPFGDELLCHPDAIGDLENKCLRSIGNPQQRYREDPVRILRALRLSTKLDLNLDPETKAQIIPNYRLLLNVPKARLFEECKKSFFCGASFKLFQKLEDYGPLELMFPQTTKAMRNHPKAEAFRHFLKLLFNATDKRIAVSDHVMPAFTIAGLWWLPIYIRVMKHSTKISNLADLRKKKIDEVAKIQRSHITIPRPILDTIHDIYSLQPYFRSREKKEIEHLINARHFRAAYDFFYLLSKAKLIDGGDYRWWEKFQQLNNKKRNLMIIERIKKHHKLKHPKLEKQSVQC